MNREERISSLRSLMKERGLKAYIIYSSDAHGSEYVSPYWRCRTWISGFTGSAGTVVVTQDEAGLWTDYRYFIQAADELKGSGIRLFKMDEPDVPSYLEWLTDILDSGDVVGMDGRTLSLGEWEAMAEVFSPMNIRIDGHDDLIGELWTDRPVDSVQPVWTLTDDEAGLSREGKIKNIRSIMKEELLDATLISSLDDIAWILNIRGGDVPYNPVVQSYLYLTHKELYWFVDFQKIDTHVRNAVESLGCSLLEYGSIQGFLSSLDPGLSLYVSADRTSSTLVRALPDGINLLKGVNISTRLKAEKNSGEQRRIRSVMEKDGSALVRFIIWVRKQIDKGGMTEIEAAEKLKEFRSAQEGFLSESFSPIPAYRAHGAICHYEANKKDQFYLEKSSLFLIDSGGQYREGTTDVTRTLALGTPTDSEIHDYTLVLKGHIALSRAVFPEGTRGYQLDTLARVPLWKEGLNYGHGTGHGVGYILNVHEGPQRISPHPVNEPLKKGMICSNEPGIYKEGAYGIRIENLILVQPWTECPGNDEFLAFETLTLCPYERSLIDVSLLDSDEIKWINEYHKEVYRRIGPLLTSDEQRWLKNETLEIC